MIEALFSVVLLLYLIGIIIASVLTLRFIPSIWKKKFSYSNLLKKSIDVFSKKPGIALVLIVLLVVATIVNTVSGIGKFFGDIANKLSDRAGESNIAGGLVGLTEVIGSLFSLLGFFLSTLLLFPLNQLGIGFLALVYQNYLKTGKLDSGLWKKMISVKGLYIILVSFLVVILGVFGLAAFVFPAILVSWALFYSPYIVVLKNKDPISALSESYQLFKKRPEDTIFLSTVTTASLTLFRFGGLESFISYLVVLPITTYIVCEFLLGGAR